MTHNCNSKENGLLLNTKSAYYDYKLLASRKYLQIAVAIAGIFNLFLLIPDLSLINNITKGISIIIVRAMYSIILFAIFFQKNRIRTFKEFSAIITVCEFAYIIIFLFVLSQYSHPNFSIQTLGIFVIIIVVFFIPNRWENMLLIATIGSIGFFIFSIIFIETIEPAYFWSTVVYIPVVILICALSALNTERHQYREFVAKSKLERISSIDYLTNTVNRYKMKEETDKWIDYCHRHMQPLSIVFIDVDDLKTINDQFGHIAGDSVLVKVSEIIQSQISESDVLARWGGDEFILLLPNITLENAVTTSTKIKKLVSDNDFIEGINVTCSFGISIMKEGSTFENMISEADEFMYTGKKLGKNKIIWC